MDDYFLVSSPLVQTSLCNQVGHKRCFEVKYCANVSDLSDWPVCLWFKKPTLTFVAGTRADITIRGLMASVNTEADHFHPSHPAFPISERSRGRLISLMW